MELQVSLADGNKIPSDYHYKGHTVPHLHIYCLQIYRRVASTISSDRAICDGVISLLQSCLTLHLGCKDLIIQALIYEVVLTVSRIEGAQCLLPLCLRSLSSFLSSRHSSVVYCGLCGLEEIFRIRSGGTTRDQQTAVLSCLAHPDTNIQRKAAQLILLLASRDNLVSIVDRVLAHVARDRSDYSSVLDRLVSIMEKYGDNVDCDWKASTLLRIIQVSKNRQREVMMERLKLLLSSCDEAEGDAATVLELNRVRLKLRSLLADIMRSRQCAGKLVPISVICLSVWCEAQFSVEDLEGVGAVLGKAFVAKKWPKKLRSRQPCPGCGVEWRYKMSMMELIGWTIVISCFPREIMNRAVVVQIDNEGTICHIRKGYDAKCVVTSSLLRATYEVARGLNSEAYAKKVARCSARGPVLADMLSKGMEDEFLAKWMEEDGVEVMKRQVPPPLKYWLEHPEVDNTLGTKILKHMRRQGVPVLL